MVSLRIENMRQGLGLAQRHHRTARTENAGALAAAATLRARVEFCVVALRPNIVRHLKTFRAF